jgi:hypothetical protein
MAEIRYRRALEAGSHSLCIVLRALYVQDNL